MSDRYAEMGGFSLPTVTRIALERIPVQARQTFPEEMLLDATLRREEMAEWTMGRLVYSLVTYMSGIPDEERVVRYPASWWDHFRQDAKGRLGAWLRRRWPVQYREVRVKVFKAVCPHVRSPGNSRHIEFLSRFTYLGDHK